MSDEFQSRRHVLKGLGAAGLISLAGARAGFAAAGGSRTAIIAAAEKEGGLVWYDHYASEEANGILKAFQKEYPFVKNPQFVDVTSAQKTARVIQECMAGGPTTDVVLNDSSTQQQLIDNGFLIEGDWKSLGVPISDVTTPTPYSALVTTAAMVIVYNPNRVSAADAPRNWDDMINPKWQGRTGAWLRSPYYTAMIPAWGEANVLDYVKKVAALKPRMFQGLYPVAQAVGAGEIDVALTAYDSATRVIEKGAPLKMAYLDPTPLNLLCGAGVKYGKNPNTARLFVAWLATNDGALEFERMTKRGNYFVPATNTAKVLKGRKVSFFKPQDAVAKAKHLSTLEAQYTRILQGRA